MNKNRILGLDIIRVIAITCVISGHFMLHTHLSETPLQGCGMYLQLFLLPIFNTGVPLFILLTGYLNTPKEYSNQYISNIKKVIISYFTISILTIIYRILYLQENFSIQQWGLKIFDFTAIPYGWYIEMYVGLYLLIPFLNILYKNIKCKKEKIIFISILAILSLFPKLLNKGNFKILPEYWISIYPICYYFIGSYIREYRPIIKSTYGLTIIILLALSEPITNYLFYNNSLISVARTVQSPLCAITAIILFLLFYQINTSYKNIYTYTIRKISILSLEMYLFSYIFDSFLYPIFIQKFYTNSSQFTFYFPIIVPCVFISSFIASQLYNLTSKIYLK